METAFYICTALLVGVYVADVLSRRFARPPRRIEGVLFRLTGEELRTHFTAVAAMWQSWETRARILFEERSHFHTDAEISSAEKQLGSFAPRRDAALMQAAAIIVEAEYYLDTKELEDINYPLVDRTLELLSDKELEEAMFLDYRGELMKALGGLGLGTSSSKTGGFPGIN